MSLSKANQNSELQIFKYGDKTKVIGKVGLDKTKLLRDAEDSLFPIEGIRYTLPITEDTETESWIKLNIICGRDSGTNIFNDKSHIVKSKHQRAQSDLISLNLHQTEKTKVLEDNPFAVSYDAYSDLAGDGSLGFDTQPGS